MLLIEFLDSGFGERVGVGAGLFFFYGETDAREAGVSGREVRVATREGVGWDCRKGGLFGVGG